MDLDIGIYPYCDSFHTTTGAVATGLGIPEEAIETTIGVFSAISVLDKAFVSKINNFPTKINETSPEGTIIQKALDERY